MSVFNRLSIFVGLVIASVSVSAADIVEIYQLAEGSDPVYRQSLASFNATLEARPQARSLLLPQVSLNANTSSNNQDISTASGFGGSGKIGFNSHGYSLDISQPVFHFDRWLNLKQADSIIQQAQAELDAALQDLMVRVAERYFDVLAAEDNLEFARAEKTALARQLEQAKQRFEVGLTAITDVQEAQAGYDRSVANEILAENGIDNSREALREITGDYILQLAPLGESMPLVKPQPAVIEDWTDLSQQQNLQVVAARNQLETARQEIQIQRSG
ncbi:MAG TPA: TolC family protein, partial [Gammaproteobacteria bacterium]|nr:TolC family protein [Gammaproteobacteria bacterium]